MFAAPQTECIKCRNRLNAKDTTCHRCGFIVDSYMFGLLEERSLDGEGQQAWQCGYRDCDQQLRTSGHSEIRPDTYAPSKGREDAYRAGWHQAAERFEAKADRKFGRKRGIKVLAGGAASLAVAGLALYAYSSAPSGDSLSLPTHSLHAVLSGRVTVWVLIIGGFGVLNIVIGLIMIITGSSDEAR